MRYLMTWMGVSTGTYMGREDGHPEMKSLIIDSLEKLVSTYRENAEYFKMERVDVHPVVKALEDLGE